MYDYIQHGELLRIYPCMIYTTWPVTSYLPAL